MAYCLIFGSLLVLLIKVKIQVILQSDHTYGRTAVGTVDLARALDSELARANAMGIVS